MNEGTGSNVADSSGNGNNGTLPNGGSWASGVASNALVLDGADDYVSIGDNATLENNATFTFAAWINPDQFFSSRDNYLMYKDKVLRWGFFSATSRQPSVDAGSGSGNPGWQGSVTSGTQLNSNVWTHIAVTYTNNTVKFYVNGLLTDTITKTYTMGSNNKAFSISTSTQSFDGKLDDVRYYSRALSDSEIGQVYGEQSTNRVYMADALGSIVALADSTKAIQTEYDYEPFGKSTVTGQSSANAYTFTSREDDGTGLYYYRARYYYPALGRFVSEDPIEYGGGDANLYGYVMNRPTIYRDQSGLFGIPPGLEHLFHFEWDPSESNPYHKWELARPAGHLERLGKAVDMGQSPVAGGGACSAGDHRWWRALQGKDYAIRQGANRISRTEFVWWFEMDTIGLFSVNRAKCVCGVWVVMTEGVPDRLIIRFERWDFDYVLGPFG